MNSHKELSPGSRTSDYDYGLPPDRIAQQPAEPRDSSKLMIVERSTGKITHGVFRDLLDLIPAGDALVLNTTRVFRARLLGARESGAPAEVLLLKKHAPTGDTHPDLYEAMIHPGSKLKPGRVVTIANGFTAEIVETTPRHTRIVRLHAPNHTSIDEAIEQHGHIPLPPYIGRPDTDADAERYQTVYAHERGSVAAPTAGLHFTEPLLSSLTDKGVERAEVVLHVGAGTFKPVADDDPAQHQMHEEWCELTRATADHLNAVRSRGGTIWAVGTTSVRTLETAAASGSIQPFLGETAIFLRPPHVFNGVDHLITNFHLPRSTLLMLVAAFAGYDLTMQAYREAIAQNYRFYSYGDAMVIL